MILEMERSYDENDFITLIQFFLSHSHYNECFL